MLLLIAGLGGFGVSNFGGSTAAIATVGDTEVDMDDYYRALQQDLRGFQAQTGQPLPLSQALQFGIDQNVRARLITGAALDNETNRIGLSIGDERVGREVLANTAFQGLDGKFDRAGYSQALDRAGLTEAEYEDSIRIETARSILQGAIQKGVKAPDAMTNAFLDFSLERRDFTWVRLDRNNLTDVVPEPTDAQLQTFYETNAAEFTEPEKKRLTYIWVTPEMIVGDIEVPETDLLEEYNKRLDEYSKPERRLVERLIYPNAEDIAAAKARLDAGEATFEELVTERGLTLLDVDLGDQSVEELEDAGEAIFALDGPGVVGPIQTNLGPALYRMNGILAATEITLDEVRQQLQNELALDRARRQINAGISDIDDLLAGGATMQEVADETNLQLSQIDWSEGDSDGIANYTAFRDAAAAVKEGDYAEMLELDDGGIFALEFVETIAPALNPINTVMSDVITGWENQEIEQRLTTLATDMLARIKDGEDLAAPGIDAVQQTGTLRDDTVEGTPSGFVEAVFKMHKGDAQTIDGNGAVFVVRLADIQPPDPENPDLPTITTNLQAQISQALSDDIFAAFNGAVQSDVGVYLNSAAVNAVHSQFPQ